MTIKDLPANCVLLRNTSEESAMHIVMLNPDAIAKNRRIASAIF